MYAGQEWTWYEQINEVSPSTVQDTRPLYLAFFSSDKGTEEITNLSGNDFFNMYGKKADFFKHGQPLIQAHRIINAGGKILGKRLVADDATLANNIFAVQLTNVTTNKTNTDGEQLYIDPTTGEETTTVTDTPATVSTASMKYIVYSVENCKSFAEAEQEALKKLNEEEGIFPLLVIADNGRGNSGKKVQIVPNYTMSKNLGFCLYEISSMEDSQVIETNTFTINPDIIYLNTNMGIRDGIMKQLRTSYCADGLTKFIEKLSEYTGYTKEYLLANDVLFGKNVKGVAIDGIEFAEGSVELDNIYGIALQNGSNGAFADAPFGKDEWKAQAISFLTGKFDDAIYDVDLYKLDIVMDANYPKEVKNAIVDLVNFREDCFFFRDLGVETATYNDITTVVNAEDWKRSKFVGDYLTTYDVIDEYSKKQIKVTMMYSLAPMLVSHFENGRNRPLAGEINNMVITEALPNTINFAPRITPYVNQKELIDDMRVNFANYSSDKLVIQSLYTSKEKLGPLSWINNVLATQEVVKAVRTYCPKIRFQFQEADDFTNYKDEVDSLLRNYNINFKSLELIYTADKIATSQKIFKAAINFEYKNFVQSEKFDVFAIDSAY